MEPQFHPTPLWVPSQTVQQQAEITRYMYWLRKEKGVQVNDRPTLWNWSVLHLEDFWASVWEFCQVKASKPYRTVLAERSMPGAQWFVGAELNYAEHALRHASSTYPAVLFRSEREALREVSWEELTRSVASVAHTLREMGVQRGDRVVAYMGNIPEALIAFLACASIGAVWSSCSPDFGITSVIDRFQQIEPTVLFAIDGYQYNGKPFDRRPMVAELQRALPTLKGTILLPYLFEQVDTASFTRTMTWNEAVRHHEAPLTFEQVPFDHPLWILYSSGTTGLPKAIVQGHGGILLEHLKLHRIEGDLRTHDRIFVFTTTSWMMWNTLVSGLLVGATVLLYDGSPAYPDLNVLWQWLQDAGATAFGTSAGFLTLCMKKGLAPGTTYDLSRLRSISSTGSPLPSEAFHWVYDHVKQDVWLASTSGGTDVCTGFVGGSLLLPVYAGELQCRVLGVKVEAFDEQGRPLINEVGELVVTEPMPSMPLFFWNDLDGKRYRESYFDMYPGIWRHGDWITITERGSAIIAGRSDATINRQGIRMGSSDIYRIVEHFPEIVDSLVIGVELPEANYYMPLFVVLREGADLDDDLKQRIQQALRRNVSPHHVPDEILPVAAIPRTLTGKKLEVPIKKLLMGAPVEKAISLDALSNPDAVHYFVEFACAFRATQEKE